jgi:cellulose synthase/poly-beta-1,6-N-acetylglucosamine synthase-like glycosyltransferase
VNVAVIATVRNERASIHELVDSLVNQTLPPSDIVIADAASDDGTREVLDELAARHQALRVIDHPGDRSAGRNAAIRSARHDVIACIDGGCVAEADWLEHLVAPFHGDAEWVAGFYRPLGRSLLSTCIGLVMVWAPDEVDPASFLPSARSMAFRRPAWERVGGFPEGLQFAEDTIFDERLLAAGLTPVFAGDAVVLWTPPANLRQLAATAFRWGRGDGRTRNSRFFPKRRLAIWVGTPVAAIAAAVIAWPLVPLAVLPLAAHVAQGTRRKYSWADGRRKYLFIPLAFGVNGFAAVTGYVVGRLSPR